MHIYDKLSKVDEFLPLAKRERYIMTYRGTHSFAALIFRGSGAAPAAPMSQGALERIDL